MSTPFTRNANHGAGNMIGREAHPSSEAMPAGERAGRVDAWWRAVLSVLLHPRVATFACVRPRARWRVVWLGLLVEALVEALGVVYAIYGPDSAAGYSSLPVGPKLLLPQTPLLPLAALIGSPAQFFIFAGLLFASARLLGGRGGFKAQAFLMVLFWAPLMVASAVVELVPAVGTVAGMLIRAYALVLLVPALAAAHDLSLRRAVAALLLIVACGLLLGAAVLTLMWPQIQPLLVP